MNENQLENGTNLYFEHYQVIQYVANELRPAAEVEIKERLVDVLNYLCKKLDGHSDLCVLRGEDPLSLWVYASERWAADDVEQDVSVFIKLKWDFKDTNAMSSLGISCVDSPDALRVLKAADEEPEEWMEELSRAHGAKKYDQFYRELDWYDEFDTFDAMKSGLKKELRDLALGLQSLLANNNLEPS